MTGVQEEEKEEIERSQSLTIKYTQNCKGRRLSRNPTSLQKRFRTRPMGLVSKNRMGARRMEANMRLCRIREALTHTNTKAMVLVRLMSTTPSTVPT